MRNHHVSTTTFLLVLAVCASGISFAQDASDDADEEQQEKLRQQARAHVEKFTVTDSDDRRYERVEAPLLSSIDTARGEFGSLWAFGTKGRPVAMLELYKNPGREQRWVQVLTLTSDDLVQARLPTGVLWAPGEKQVDSRPLPNAPAPAERSALRERQAKLLARRFDAHQFWDPNNSRFELRLLQTPLHTYRDEETGLLDGIVFAFVHGTNAEVLLFIEAHAQQQRPPQWMYSLARLGSAEMHVNLDEQVVWQLDRTPGVVGRATHPYWISFAAAESE